MPSASMDFMERRRWPAAVRFKTTKSAEVRCLWHRGRGRMRVDGPRLGGIAVGGLFSGGVFGQSECREDGEEGDGGDEEEGGFEGAEAGGFVEGDGCVELLRGDGGGGED